MENMELLGTLGIHTFLAKIIWSTEQGNHYRYVGEVEEAIFIATPALTRDRDKAQDRYYLVDISFNDGRPNISKMVRYYFLPAHLKQNHIMLKDVVWSRELCRPVDVVKPAPRRGPERVSQHHLILFYHEGKLCPVFARSVERAWRQHYDYSPVKIDLIGYLPYTQEDFKTFTEYLEPTRIHGHWYDYTFELQELVARLPLTRSLG